ncbi:hypothetical protein LCGC14_1287610 [marine sediment metagenome]|uniref:Uncharacterized protein n=1 Tax=marine sediment metagenome TaxID=412755 RepID=A0A0F9LEC6_9ZZZZ
MFRREFLSSISASLLLPFMPKEETVKKPYQPPKPDNISWILHTRFLQMMNRRGMISDEDTLYMMGLLPGRGHSYVVIKVSADDCLDSLNFYDAGKMTKEEVINKILGENYPRKERIRVGDKVKVRILTSCKMVDNKISEERKEIKGEVTKVRHTETQHYGTVIGYDVMTDAHCKEYPLFIFTVCPNQLTKIS